MKLEHAPETGLSRNEPLSFSMHADIAAGTQVEQRVGHGLTGHLEPETPGSHRGRASTPPGSAHVVGSVLGQARNAARQAAYMG